MELGLGHFSNGYLLDATIVGLVGLGAFLIGAVAYYLLIFYREARGSRTRATLVGAATVIAIVVATLIAVFSQPLPLLTPPPRTSGQTMPR